jgi:hypothetical protein
MPNIDLPYVLYLAWCQTAETPSGARIYGHPREGPIDRKKKKRSAENRTGRLQRIVDDGRSRIVEHRQGRVLGKRKSRPEVSGGWRSDAGAGIVRPCQ